MFNENKKTGKRLSFDIFIWGLFPFLFQSNLFEEMYNKLAIFSSFKKTIRIS